MKWRDNASLEGGDGSRWILEDRRLTLRPRAGKSRYGDEGGWKNQGRWTHVWHRLGSIGKAIRPGAPALGRCGSFVTIGVGGGGS